ncbi:hypothetical protein Pmani_018726 [Petrolisthes manimaculis]|uniref:C2H2-type domain-containing protein n=1 Tax=Petrolisthes manimaculis TaxID=1843537 RepID=A0AAE1PJ39_9EUCA|nr:hypothetical protein Pmani_018726 [Petrolisthes manimaculis]
MTKSESFRAVGRGGVRAAGSGAGTGAVKVEQELVETVGGVGARILLQERYGRGGSVRRRDGDNIRSDTAGVTGTGSASDCGGGSGYGNSEGGGTVQSTLPGLQCPECGKMFYGRNRRQLVGRHRIIHTGERPFQCPLCLRRMNVKHHLTRHLRTVHVDKLDALNKLDLV